MNLFNKKVETDNAQNEEPGGLVLFDGVCDLCNKFVKFVLAHDTQGSFTFASLRSDIAREILSRHGQSPTPKAIYLVKFASDGEKLYCKSEATLKVISEVQGTKKLGKLILRLPAPLRDLGYDLAANIRTKAFG